MGNKCTFIIGYKTKNGNTGQGLVGFSDRNWTLKYIDLLNKKHPDITHYILDAPKGTPLADITDYSLENLTEY